MLSQAYVNYDCIVDKNYDIDKVLNFIKKTYNKKVGYKSDLDVKAFGSIVAFTLTDVLEQCGVKDNHFIFKYDVFDNSFFFQTYSFFSNIYFIKNNEDYLVYFSDNEKIKPGMKYTGNIENLKTCIFNGECVYQFIYFSDSSEPNVQIQVDNKNYPIIVKRNRIYQSKEPIIYEETSNSIYIYLQNLNLGITNSNRINELHTIFDDIIEKINTSDVNKNVILDLRGNNGGYVELLYQLLVPIFYRTTYEKYPAFESIINLGSYGRIELQSKEIENAILKYQIANNIENLISLSDVERSYKGLEHNAFSYLPQLGNEKLNGKLIILINQYTASAAEYGIASSYLINKDKIILVGDKSSGTIETGSWYTYQLPNSKVEIKLSTVNHSKETMFINNERWHGDTLGFYPDYWISDDYIIASLVSLTGDEELNLLFKTN